MKQEQEIQAQLCPTGITWRERTWAVQMFSPLTRFLHHIRKKNPEMTKGNVLDS